MRISDFVDVDDRPDEPPERVACPGCGRAIPVGEPCPNCGGEPVEMTSVLDRRDPTHRCPFCDTVFDPYVAEDGQPKPGGRVCPSCDAAPCPGCGERREAGEVVCDNCGNSRLQFLQ